MPSKMNIAIIGGGLAGLTCAHYVKEHANVTVFEKARGVGGRMSTRYADPFQFDHGAQYFTAREKPFQAFLQPLIDQGLIAEWRPKVMTLAKGEKPYDRDWFEPHYVAAPKMNALCKALAEGVDVQIQQRIDRLERVDNHWILHTEAGQHGPFDWVISSAPAPQTVALMPETCAFRDVVAQATMVGCYSLMLGFENAERPHWDAAKVKDSPLYWLSLNHTRPGREATSFSLLALADNIWAEAHIDDDQADVKRILCDELQALTGLDASQATYSMLHRWRYADVTKAAGEAFLLDEASGLAACGDWCIAGRVEAAFMSAYQLAQKLLALSATTAA